MPFDLSQPDLDVWEKTFLPTISSRNTNTESLRTLGVLYSPRFLEDGTTEFQRVNCSVKDHELLFSPQEECSNYLRNTPDNSRTLSKPSTLGSMARQQNLDHSDEEMTDENTCEEWPQTRLTLGDFPRRMESGNSHRNTSRLASAIRKIGRLFRISFR